MADLCLCTVNSLVNYFVVYFVACWELIPDLNCFYFLGLPWGSSLRGNAIPGGNPPWDWQSAVHWIAAWSGFLTNSSCCLWACSMADLWGCFRRCRRLSRHSYGRHVRPNSQLWDLPSNFTLCRRLGRQRTASTYGNCTAEILAFKFSLFRRLGRQWDGRHIWPTPQLWAGQTAG